jgi:inosine-uridine nucleoside N-ribohydrolase
LVAVHAILLAARTLDLRGITTVHGNASLTNTTRNARQTVEFAELTLSFGSYRA